jgi:hypothetical protein
MCCEVMEADRFPTSLEALDNEVRLYIPTSNLYYIICITGVIVQYLQR